MSNLIIFQFAYFLFIIGRCRDDVYISSAVTLPTSPNFKSIKEMSIEEGESYAITCFTFGDTYSSIYKDLIEWKKDGLPVSYNMAKKLKNTRISGQNYDSFDLHLKQVNESYGGTYTCHRSFPGCPPSKNTQSIIRLNYIGKNIFLFKIFKINFKLSYRQLLKNNFSVLNFEMEIQH